MMIVVNDVKTHRIKKGWTQAELAEKINVSRQTVIAIEKGGYEPSLKLSLMMSKLFGEPIESLFYLKDENDDN